MPQAASIPLKPTNLRRNSNLIVILTGKHEDSQIFLGRKFEGISVIAQGLQTATPPLGRRCCQILQETIRGRI
jgi:hypothetical protein